MKRMTARRETRSAALKPTKIVSHAARRSSRGGNTSAALADWHYLSCLSTGEDGSDPLNGRALRVIEQNPGRAIAKRLEERCLVYLPVTYLDGASKRCGSGINEPVQRASGERRAPQQRMIVPLHDD